MKRYVAMALLVLAGVLAGAQSGAGPTIVKPMALKWDPFMPGIELAVYRETRRRRDSMRSGCALQMGRRLLRTGIPRMSM